MRVLLVTHYYPPESGAPQARLSEMAARWVELGLDVTVLTGMPNHPTGVVAEGYRGAVACREQRDGVRVLRNWVYATPNEGFVKKTLGHLSFMVSSVLLGGPRIDRPDVVVVSSPTFFSIGSAWVLARLHRARLVVEVRDLWPAIFVELGVLTNRRIISLLERLELAAYRAADAVVVVTDGFRDDLVRRGVPVSKVTTMRNGVDLERFSPGSKPIMGDRSWLGGMHGELLVLYVGAHGVAKSGNGSTLGYLADQPSRTEANAPGAGTRTPARPPSAVAQCLRSHVVGCGTRPGGSGADGLPRRPRQLAVPGRGVGAGGDGPPRCRLGRQAAPWPRGTGPTRGDDAAGRRHADSRQPARGYQPDDKPAARSPQRVPYRDLPGGGSDGAGWRRLGQAERRNRLNVDDAEPVIILGAGDGGRQFIRSIRTATSSNRWRPVALLDDDLRKRHLRIYGVPVRGTSADIESVSAAMGASLLVVAIPSADSASIRRISESAAVAGVKVKLVPGLTELLHDRVDIHDLRDINLSDALGRRPVTTALRSIASYLTGRRVLVTGAGGSIGAELCRQIHQWKPAELIMFDRDESALHAVQLSIEGKAMLDSSNVVLGDLRGISFIDALFTERRPQVVFHAAA